MVIGGVGLSELAPALKDAEARLLRPVNPSVYRAEEVGREAPRGASLPRDGHGRSEALHRRRRG